jgi:hypothetical protein
VFQQLDATQIVKTSSTLQRRIEERFEGSGLSRVAQELRQVAEEAAALSDWLDRPIWWVRIAVGTGIGLLFAVIVFTLVEMRVGNIGTLSELVPFLEALVNDVVFIAVGVYFLAGVEVRLKRKRAQQALHVLRSLAHIVDMHQLTKDPEKFVCDGPATASSPSTTMTAFELTRYLDYCSEILSILSKVAAVYVQHFEDSVTVAAASDVETLTGGLTQKIWQKIMILDRIVVEKRASEAPAPTV